MGEVVGMRVEEVCGVERREKGKEIGEEVEDRKEERWERRREERACTCEARCEEFNEVGLGAFLD